MMNLRTIERLNDIQIAFYNSGLERIQKHPDWNVRTDARIIVFAKAANVISCVKLCLLLAESDVGIKSLSTVHPACFNHMDNDPNRHKELENFIRFAFIQGMFALHEHALRLFLRSIDASACNGGASEFKSIYEALFKRLSLSQAEKADCRNCLDLLRELRNASHNNGVYFPTSGQPKTIHYRSRDYVFQVNAPIPFMSWHLLLLLACDAGTMLTTVIDSAEVSSIPVVLDPANFTLK